MPAQPAPAALDAYNAMRDFAQSPEPAGVVGRSGTALSFVIQKHAARSLHYDFRLELDGTLKSWAVPKGPSLDPADKRMAVEVEDHPLSYGGFEGTIPEGHYGAGTVIVWDRGSWSPIGDPRAGLAAGHLKFELTGAKLQGRWALVRMRRRAGDRQPAWLLTKERDDAARAASDYSVVEAEPDSVLAKPPARRRTAAARKTVAANATATASVPTTPLMPAVLPAGARITHAERVIDPASGCTKGDLVAYYASVAPLLLPHLKDRPVALLRAPAGVSGQQFFQKHAEVTPIANLTLLDPALDAGHPALLAITSAAGLVFAAQMNVIELHTWNGTIRSITQPDRMVFDLDPGEGVAWAQMQEGALKVRELLQQLGLDAFLKTSGGKGLHVVVPLAARTRWQTVRAFSQAIVKQLAAQMPERFVAKSGAKNRVGRVYVDFLRNGWGSTTASAWSARARPGLGISVPVGWDELPVLTSGAHWTIRNAAERVAVGNAPWAAYATARQGLVKPMKALGFDAPKD
jgi:bifunctional non-homologous end joining protein LigD